VSARPEADWRPLLSGLERRERRALARCITLVENRAPGYRDLLAQVYARGRGAFRVGVTGPPGAGKSTLVDALAGLLAQDGLQVGVVAVDPTSPFTGGALLGDRVRMSDLSSRDGVFIRSMATRGTSGGIAAATRDTCAVMDAYGFDWLLVETVGVGQIELDVMNVCDVVCAVFVPESGDGIQALKAGLVEAAHLFIINKADRPGAGQLASELEHVLRTRNAAPPWIPPVLLTEAVHRRGITEWRDQLEAFRSHLNASAHRPEVKRRQALADLENVLRERLHAYLATQLTRDAMWPELAERLAQGQLDPHGGADRVWARWLASSPTPKPGES
jgi:LAO/AO transport system kinase